MERETNQEQKGERYLERHLLLTMERVKIVCHVNRMLRDTLSTQIKEEITNRLEQETKITFKWKNEFVGDQCKVLYSFQKH
jgi:hypothetical protein